MVVGGLVVVVVVGGAVVDVVVGAGPLDTITCTVEPFCTLAPALGLVPITLPAGTEAELCWVLVTLKPAWPSWFEAVARSSPPTSGTGISGSPVETVMVTTEPLSCWVWAAGAWLIT